MSAKSKIQYSCAVLLIASSIALAFLSDFMHGDIPNGTLLYIAQAFLLAGSIFGLEYYITKLNRFINEREGISHGCAAGSSPGDGTAIHGK